MDPDLVAKLLGGATPPGAVSPGPAPPGMLNTLPPTISGMPGMLGVVPPPSAPPAGPTQDYGMHLGHGPQYPYAMGAGPDMEGLQREVSERDKVMMQIQDPQLRALIQQRHLREEIDPNMKMLHPRYPEDKVSI